MFEARQPKGKATLCEGNGEITSIEAKQGKQIITVTDETLPVGTKERERVYEVPYTSRLRVKTGDKIKIGERLTEGSVYPQDLLRIKGIKDVQEYLVKEVQSVYRLQGVEINDKHVEIVVRQMMRKVKVEDSGDTKLLPGEIVDIFAFDDANFDTLNKDGRPAAGKRVLLGITKASLATESFLSAASFQETSRVLTEAAIKGKVDPLSGLKENVIIGKLISAGTGLPLYRNCEVKEVIFSKDNA